ncbi:DNA-binding response regulator [Enterovibrio norvegicus FF-33]|uniref:DNA-binding response regulator n=1 Tax=Enterovibrio norvegicus FF-454 TaxID=1185651 RepID=A0A1E5C9V4_9GAMM|nr:response regulator transcription factor [Enterovibrio norvegicus]OEE62265.1 DNA-binding response regulator [Enterovibrio norvegicus FF-454]OEE65917.1 DNA-binding response regulator [Enterovibrio norvegicus FF-33]
MNSRVSHIVVVDDEHDVRTVLTDALRQIGYTVTPVSTGDELYAADNVDLAVIDLRLNNEDGLQLARQLRENSDIPIMMLTGKGDETDRIIGLEVAADDYMMKPFNLREFTARINALLRRSQNAGTKRVSVETNETVYQFDDWTLYLSRRLLQHADGRTPDLTYGEFSLLEAFISSPQRVLTREHLMERTHGYDSDSLDRTIDVLVVRLRRKIESNPRIPRLIKTERGLGYCFDASVTKLVPQPH